MKRIHTLTTLFLLGFVGVFGIPGASHAQSFAYNNKLQRELGLTQTYCNNLKPKMAYLQTKVSRANTVLNITRRVSNATDKIEKRLKANIDVMFPLTFVPKVGKLIKTIRKGVQLVHRKVKPVNRTLKKADKAIEPYRKPLPSISRALQYSQRGFKMTCQFAAIYAKANKKVADCLRRLQPGALKTKLVAKLESQAKTILPILQKINKVLKTVDDATNATDRALQYPASLYPGFLKFERGFRPIELALNYSHYPIKYLNIALKTKITIVVPKKFKVKIKVKFDPLKPDLPKFKIGFRTRKLRVSFTIRQILNGIEGPFKYLEKQFMKLALKKLGPISAQFRKLKSMFDKLQIPGVTAYMGKIKKLKLDLKQLALFSKTLLVNLPQINVRMGYTVRDMARMLGRIRCAECRGSSYLTSSGTCKRCTGNTYATYYATTCRPCPKGTHQVDHYRCVKRVASCLTHPRFLQSITQMKRTFSHTIKKTCGITWTVRKHCVIQVLWKYSPVLTRNLGCNIQGGYASFFRTLMKKNF